MDDQEGFQTLVALYRDRQETLRHWKRLIANLQMLQKVKLWKPRLTSPNSPFVQ